MTTTESSRTVFERDGIVFPIPAVPPEKAAAYQACFAELEQIADRPLGRVAHPAMHFGWAYRLATEPAVLDAVEEVLGPDLLIAGSLVLCKYPRDPAFVAWHQDNYYSNLHLTPSLSAWIALRDSTTENGCMRVVPGSHREGVLPHEEKGNANNLLKQGQEIQVEVDEADAVEVVLRAGEMSLHHSAIIHGSRPNRSDTQRLGFIIRFVTSAYDLAGQQTPFILARGRAEQGNLRLAPSPLERPLAEAWADYQRQPESGPRDFANPSVHTEEMQPRGLMKNV
ncbi:MAG TPA: phytanoyl-CoA dioxygenase family protein [Chthoniobacterales bacterium]|nr:phytanoyl-CoA dioxygenase family protein [Chthoniobacterales bacterium]